MRDIDAIAIFARYVLMLLTPADAPDAVYAR